MRKIVLLMASLMFVAACEHHDTSEPEDVVGQLASYEHLPGYFDLYWD